MTKRERLARAALSAKFGQTEPDADVGWTSVSPVAQQAWFRVIDAILAELRKPDEKMLEAWASFGGQGGYSAQRAEDGEIIWQEGIDAIE